MLCLFVTVAVTMSGGVLMLFCFYNVSAPFFGNALNGSKTNKFAVPFVLLLLLLLLLLLVPLCVFLLLLVLVLLLCLFATAARGTMSCGGGGGVLMSLFKS